VVFYPINLDVLWLFTTSLTPRTPTCTDDCDTRSAIVVDASRANPRGSNIRRDMMQAPARYPQAVETVTAGLSRVCLSRPV
jgi:hypothetical protein